MRVLLTETLGLALRLAALAILLLVALCVWDLHRTLAELRLTAQKATDTEIVVGGAARDLELTLRGERQAADAQIQATTAMLGQAQRDLADVDKAALSLNATLGTVNTTVGTLNGAIEDQTGRADAIEMETERDLADFDADEKSLADVMAKASATIAQANALLADPSIPQDLAAVHDSLDHMEKTSEHVDAGTADLAAAIHRETRPASFAMKTAGVILKGVSQAGSILAGFIK